MTSPATTLPFPLINGFDESTRIGERQKERSPIHRPGVSIDNRADFRAVYGAHTCALDDADRLPSDRHGPRSCEGIQLIHELPVCLQH